MLATWVFMLPGAFVYTWLGHAGRDALAGGDGTLHNITMAVSLLALMAFLPRLVRKLKTLPQLMLDVADLKHQLDAGNDLLLLDVRPAADFTGEWGHIPNALSVPLEDLPQRMAEFEAHKQRPIRLVCRTDRRSSQAASLLADAGFTQAQVIQGGMTAWRAKGWPVVSH